MRSISVLQPIGRVALGALFLFAGLNYWFELLPQPYGVRSLAKELIEILVETRLFDVVKAVEAVGGLFILLNRFTALALLAVLPISVVAAFFGIVLEHSNRSIATGGVTLVVHGLLMLSYLKYYRSALSWRPVPGKWQ